MTLRFDLVILLSDESNRIDGEIDGEDVSIYSYSSAFSPLPVQY